jgi:prepilin-type N-terminal cleavage/methylation domain-containing protein/prepilin-type processing-associated H-X9-DG protein
MRTCQANHSSSRRGFTLIELLVVIAIIAVLIGLLLPAVQRVREAANMTACKNNLHQIGVAVQNYHSAYNKFPSGSRCTDVNHCYGNWAIYILPFMEQDNLFSTYNDGVINTSQTETFRTTLVPTFVCPTDPGASTARVPGSSGPAISNGNLLYMPTNYKGNTGLNDGNNLFFDRFDNAATLLGTATRRAWLGPLTVTNSGTGSPLLGQVRLEQIKDGSSNTMLVGEYSTTTGTQQRAYWAYSYWEWSLSSVPVVADPSGNTADNKAPNPNVLLSDFNACGGSSVCKRGWSAIHPGGLINFVFCDGSVRSISRSIDMQVMANLSTINGKEANVSID